MIGRIVEERDKKNILLRRGVVKSWRPVFGKGGHHGGCAVLLALA